MVERERRREGVESKGLSLRGIIAALGAPLRLSNEDNGHRVVTRITPRIGIDAEQGTESDFQPRLFLRFTPRGLLHGLADLHEAAR